MLWDEHVIYHVKKLKNLIANFMDPYTTLAVLGMLASSSHYILLNSFFMIGRRHHFIYEAANGKIFIDCEGVLGRE